MPLPFSLSLLLLALLLLWFTRFQKSGKLLASLSLLLVTLMGMRPVSYELARGLEQTFPLRDKPASRHRGHRGAR